MRGLTSRGTAWQGNTTDWLIDAIDYAAEGKREQALAACDRITDLATTNCIAVAAAIEEADGRTPRRKPEFSRLIREFTEPLRQILQGISLVKVPSPHPACDRPAPADNLPLDHCQG